MEMTGMITEAEGNLLAADVEALVNTVNTVGVMGKGIALQFKRAFPEMFKAYAAAADHGELELGRMHVWQSERLEGPRYIINFPTKGHWRSSSRLADIDAGLDDLARVIDKYRIGSIAVPPLGCGHGGLAWDDVAPLIRTKLDLPGVDVRIYPPNGAPRAADMPVGGTAPRMTPGRAALVALVDRYASVAIEGVTQVEVQKLMYFLQEAGEPLRLHYGQHFYGPYADNLRHVLQEVEGHYLQGYGDGSQKVAFAEPITVLPGAMAEVEATISEHPETVQRIARVMTLIGGFESADSLELLATVHAVAKELPGLDETGIVSAVHAWSPRKQRMFSERHIRVAVESLREGGWLGTPAAV